MLTLETQSTLIDNVTKLEQAYKDLACQEEDIFIELVDRLTQMGVPNAASIVSAVGRTGVG